MRHESALGMWEMVPGVPDVRLRGHVLSYTGYLERTIAPLRRLQLPMAAVPLILSLGPELLVDGVPRRSFAAGLGQRVTVTEHDGEQLGVEVCLAPLGARRLLGLPLVELTDRVVPVEDLLGSPAALLVEQLREAPGWKARFELLDRVLLARLECAAPIAAEVEHAWRRLRDGDGAVAIMALARETGWSRRHLSARFHADVGLPPKAVARILRFEKVMRSLRERDRAGLADLAYACGYADQAHLNRDFREFAGTTPTDYVARLLPGAAGVHGGEVANIQDALARAA